jgi:peptidoglycan hydrolase-like protein with peptidoglycan-binding domain
MPPATPNRPLTTNEIREAQTLLNEQGYNPGGADGIAGPNTVAAAKNFEQKRGWPATGTMDLQLLERLRANRPGGAMSAQSEPKTVSETSADSTLAERVIREANHPCPAVLAARRLSDGSLRAACSNGEIYRLMSLRGQWLAMRCSAAQRLGVDGC